MKTSLALIASLATASAFAPSSPCSSSTSALSATRRESIEQLFGNAATTAAIALTAAVQPAAAAASATSEEAEYNELINVLKTRSEENQEANKNYAMRANKMDSRYFDDVKTRRPKLMWVKRYPELCFMSLHACVRLLYSII